MKTLLIVMLLLLPALAFAEDVTFKFGGFIPSANSDIWEVNEDETTFSVSDMAGGYVAGEIDLFLGRHFNFACEVGYYQKDVLVEDIDFEYPDGWPIEHVVYLRTVPLQASFKFLPLGRNRKIIPYVGGGLGFYFWDYQEYGDFVIYRYDDPEIITGYYQSTGVDLGYHGMFGLMIPIGWHYSVNAEIKYVSVDGNLGNDFDPTFEPIDLSGIYATAGISFWF